MSNKSNATVVIFRPVGGDEDPTTMGLTPYSDSYTKCEIVKWGVNPNPFIVFKSFDHTGKAVRVSSAGLPFTFVEDVDQFSAEGCTCEETDGKSCPIPSHQPAFPEGR